VKRVCILTCVLLSCALAQAQNISCALSGTVQDPGGAVFPGVEVALTSAENGFVRTTKTNQDGFFSFPDLTASTFTLALSTPGFKRYSQSGIQVNSGEQRSLGVIQLQLGEVSESVSVTADVNRVKLASGERGTVLTQEDLAELSLRGRDFMDAVALLPGVIDITEGREVPSSGSMNDIYILGGRSNQKNMTVDGVTNLDSGSNRSVQTMPSLSSIGEVQVLMSNYAAEYGRNSGGTITVITRGGGKQFHGSAGWYHRHEQFTANDFFNNERGLPRSRYRFNIMDYTVSGPIYVPGRFNQDRSKLFFFFSREFQQQLVNYGTKTIRVPTELERAGDFSQSFDVNARLFTVYDPLNNQRAFPGNRIPADRFDSIGQSIFKLFPKPNYLDPLPSRRYQWNYIEDLSGPHPRRTESFRVDYSPRTNLQLYGRYSTYHDSERPAYGSGSNFYFTPVVQLQPGWGGTFHAAVTLSPTFFNEFIFGVSERKHNDWVEFPERVSRRALGIDVPQWYPSTNPDGLMASMTFGGVPNAANPSIANRLPYYNSNPIFSFVENLSKVSGTHTLKFGVYIERTRKDESPSVPTRGTLSFDRDRNNPLDTNYAYANVLLGNYEKYSEANGRPQGFYRFTNFEWYVQDNWRARRRLSIEYGLRFYHDLPQYDQRGQLASFMPSAYNPAQAPVLIQPGFDVARKRVGVDPLTGANYPQVLIGTFVPGAGNPYTGMVVGGEGGLPSGLYSVSAISLAPRLGFAWDPFGRGRTALRGGIGVFFDRIAGNPTMSTMSNPPTILTPTVCCGTLEGLAETNGRQILAPTSIIALTGQQKMPTVYNYSFGFQHQVGKMIVDASYVGSISRHLLWERNINPVPIGARYVDEHPENRDITLTNPPRPLPDNFLRPYQGFSDIYMFEFGSTSNYNSFQLSLNRRMTRNVAVRLAYTFSKTLGSAADDGVRVSPFFAPRTRNYGVLPYDLTRVMALSYNWTLPKPGKRLGSRKLGILTDNWELSGITRMMSGAPFSPTFDTVDGQDITGTPSEGARTVLLDPHADLRNRFGRPARGTFGNTGIGALRLPGINNWDISLYRRIRIGDRKSAQIRVESYNTFNHTQFSALYTKARFDLAGNQVDPEFLEPTRARGPRRIHLALRFNW
jgi:hypothetical protein